MSTVQSHPDSHICWTHTLPIPGHQLPTVAQFYPELGPMNVIIWGREPARSTLPATWPVYFLSVDSLIRPALGKEQTRWILIRGKAFSLQTNEVVLLAKSLIARHSKDNKNPGKTLGCLSSPNLSFSTTKGRVNWFNMVADIDSKSLILLSHPKHMRPSLYSNIFSINL